MVITGFPEILRVGELHIEGQLDRLEGKSEEPSLERSARAEFDS